MLQISDEAIDLIINEEVSGRAAYEAHYRHPEWPGGNSGVTVGIGYDLGMSTTEKIEADWGDKIESTMVEAMCSAAGIHGDAARPLARSLHDQIDIPWEAAADVFANRDIPLWIGNVHAALENTDKLSPDSLGALVSLAYNRGASFHAHGDRFREMNAIAAHMSAQEFDKIPGEIRSMKRLWDPARLPGLITRREHEAVLFEKGLSANA